MGSNYTPRTLLISGTVRVQYSSFPAVGCANWYEVMRASSATVLPVPVGISSMQWPFAVVDEPGANATSSARCTTHGHGQARPHRTALRGARPTLSSRMYSSCSWYTNSYGKYT